MNKLPLYLAIQMRDWAERLKRGHIVPVRLGLAQAVRILGAGDSTPGKRIIVRLFEAWLDNLSGEVSSWTMDRIYNDLQDVAKDIEDESCE